MTYWQTYAHVLALLAIAAGVNGWDVVSWLAGTAAIASLIGVVSDLHKERTLPR